MQRFLAVLFLVSLLLTISFHQAIRSTITQQASLSTDNITSLSQPVAKTEQVPESEPPSPVESLPAEPLLADFNVVGFTQNGTVGPLGLSAAEDLQFISHNTISTWEGLIENIGQPTARVHLIDTQKFEGHYGYTKQALGRGTGYSQRNFFDEVQQPERRRYMPFLLFDFRGRPLQWQGKSYQWVLNVRRYDYADGDTELAAMITELKELISSRLMLDAGEPLLFVYDKQGSFRRPHVANLSAVEAAGFATVTEVEMITAAGGKLVSVLNPGVAVGYLQRIGVGESTAGLTPRHIAIFEDTPERIPPVTGIVTLEAQTPLSHVNLLAKNRGTPNVSTTNIDLVPNLEQLTGKLVRMNATADGTVQLKEVSLAEAEIVWNQSKQQDVEIPPITATSLEAIDFTKASESEASLPNIGSKASNYATIQNLLGTELVKPGFGLSFAHYRRVVAEPTAQRLIENLLENKDTLTPQQINRELQEIRISIREGTSDRAIAPTIEAIRDAIAQMPGVERIRLRSSTNSEDLPVFNGAGLYESTGFNVEAGDRKLKKKLLTVMSSLWLERAFWERELFGIDHRAVGMAVLINPAFSDEYGNGVVIGSQEPDGFKTWVNAQIGEASVTNPLENEIPESFTLTEDRIESVEVQSRSNISSVFLEKTDNTVNIALSPQLMQLQQVTRRLHDYFVTQQYEVGDQRRYGIDIEYKLMQEGDKVVLYVKQGRLLNLESEVY